MRKKTKTEAPRLSSPRPGTSGEAVTGLEGWASRNGMLKKGGRGWQGRCIWFDGTLVLGRVGAGLMGCDWPGGAGRPMGIPDSGLPA